jgi:hypothetical protein
MASAPAAPTRRSGPRLTNTALAVDHRFWLYRTLLVDESTFASVTVEELLAANVLPAHTATALCKRYIPHRRLPRPPSVRSRGRKR